MKQGYRLDAERRRYHYFVGAIRARTEWKSREGWARFTHHGEILEARGTTSGSNVARVHQNCNLPGEQNSDQVLELANSTRSRQESFEQKPACFVIQSSDPWIEMFSKGISGQKGAENEA